MENNIRNEIAWHLVRIGLAVTFMWIGALVIRDPIGWSGFIKPFFRNLIENPEQAMLIGGYVDILIGIFLLIAKPKIIAFLGALGATFHLLGILIVSPLDGTVVRDIGLFGAAFGLLIHYWPQKTTVV